MSNQLGIGIIGTGNIASSGHGPAIGQVDGAKLVAVLSRSLQDGKAFLSKMGSAGRAYDDVKAFLHDDEIQLVIITSPDGLHYEQAKRCLVAGKHVLVEKPMTLEVHEAEELTRLAESKGLVLAIGFHLRSHSGHRLIKERLDSGAIGEGRHIRIMWAWPVDSDQNWRANDDFPKWESQCCRVALH